MKRNAPVTRQFAWVVLLAAISICGLAFSILVRTTPRAAQQASDAPVLTVIATVPVGSQLQWLGVNPTTNCVYVANDGNNSVSVIADGPVPDGFTQ